VGSVAVTVGSADYVWAVPFDRRNLLHILQSMLSAVEKYGIAAPARVEIRLVDDNTMRTVNTRFMSCPGPTNVLSFPGGEDMPGLILVSPGAVSRECLIYGQRPDEYMLLLLAHGVAHLAGFEHGPAMNTVCDICMAAARQKLNSRTSC